MAKATGYVGSGGSAMAVANEALAGIAAAAEAARAAGGKAAEQRALQAAVDAAAQHPSNIGRASAAATSAAVSVAIASGAPAWLPPTTVTYAPVRVTAPPPPAAAAPVVAKPAPTMSVTYDATLTSAIAPSSAEVMNRPAGRQASSSWDYLRSVLSDHLPASTYKLSDISNRRL